MEKNLKRLSVALLALGLSAPAFADCCVTVPSQKGGFKVGVDALYLRPTNADLNFATTIAFPTEFPAGFERNHSLEPSYDWGLYAQIGYLFPCTGNDVTVGYTYLRSDENRTLALASPNSTGPVIAIPVLSSDVFGAGINFGGVAAKSRFHLNVVDLEAGQRFTMCAYDMRMFAGLRYANINHKLHTAGVPFSGLTGFNDTTIGFTEHKNTFRGIGPRIGVDGRYCLNSGFGIDADLSTSLLIGNVDANLHAARITTPTSGPVSVTAFEVRDNSHKRMIPVVEAKLGVDYTYIMDCRCKSSLVFEAGYQATNYFNVVDRPRVADVAFTSGVGSPVSSGFDLVSQQRTTDLAFDGPYFGVKYYA